MTCLRLEAGSALLQMPDQGILVCKQGTVLVSP